MSPVSPPEREIALYEALIATHPEIDQKGKSSPYTSINGNMFSLYTKEGTLALRLPPDEREAFLEKYRTRLTEQYGAVMREYVDVPDALLFDTRTLKRYFAASYEYAKSLRPKPTTRSSAAKKRR